jgi:hypothetical protein
VGDENSSVETRNNTLRNQLASLSTPAEHSRLCEVDSALHIAIFARLAWLWWLWKSLLTSYPPGEILADRQRLRVQGGLPRSSRRKPTCAHPAGRAHLPGRCQNRAFASKKTSSLISKTSPARAEFLAKVHTYPLYFNLSHRAARPSLATRTLHAFPLSSWITTGGYDVGRLP